LAKVSVSQAQCSYYYRHGGNTQLSDAATPEGEPQHIKLDSLGLNRNGLPIRALALDTLFLPLPELAMFNVKTRTHHQLKIADILFADGHTYSSPNLNGRYVVDLRNPAEIRDAFNKILKVLEAADTAH
jgi:prepilin-type processing-associated H-X9-DG protein